jgi:hypothetical protein
VVYVLLENKSQRFVFAHQIHYEVLDNLFEINLSETVIKLSDNEVYKKMIFAHNKHGQSSVQIVNAEPKDFKHLAGHLPSDILPNEKNKYKIPINSSMSPTDFWTFCIFFTPLSWRTSKMEPIITGLRFHLPVKVVKIILIQRASKSKLVAVISIVRIIIY